MTEVIDLHILITHFAGGIIFMWFMMKLGNPNAMSMTSNRKWAVMLPLLVVYFITFFMPLYLNRYIDGEGITTLTPLVSFIGYASGLAVGSITYIFWGNRKR